MESINKSRRSIIQPYVPVHRRNKQEQHSSIAPLPTSRSSSTINVNKDESDIKRRGRGQFRAPSNDSINNLTGLEEAENSKSELVDIYESKEKNKDDSLESHNQETGKAEPTTKKETDKGETKVEETKTEEKDDWEEEDWEASLNLDVKTKLPTKSPSPSTPTATVPSPIIDDDATTVLDCFDFPSSFKTFHLQDIFKEYETMKGGFSIKWMDDTRALIIFEHPNTAKKAYIDNLNSPLIKIKPYKGEIDKKPATGPIPRRPVTTDMVARRLVHNALGVRSTKTAEQRQAEKDLLKAAREQRHAQKANIVNREKEIANAFDE